MVDARHDLDFPEEALLRVLRVVHSWLDDLDRHGAAERKVPGLVNEAHPPAVQRLEDLVVGDLLARHVRLATGARIIAACLVSVALRSLTEGGERPGADSVEGFRVRPRERNPRLAMINPTGSLG